MGEALEGLREGRTTALPNPTRQLSQKSLAAFFLPDALMFFPPPSLMVWVDRDNDGVAPELVMIIFGVDVEGGKYLISLCPVTWTLVNRSGRK